MPGNASAQAVAEGLGRDFLERVWGSRHDIAAIDELMTPDYVIHSGGKTVRGRDAFKAWVVEFHRLMPEAIDEVQDVFANAAGDRVCARWINRGRNNGLLGLPPDGRRIEFHGISVWSVREGRLATISQGKRVVQGQDAGASWLWADGSRSGTAVRACRAGAARWPLQVQR